MNRKLLDFIKRIFYKLGFYVEIKRLPDPNTLRNNLSPYPNIIQFQEIRNLAKFYLLVDDHKAYSELLHAFVPEYDNSLSNLEFIGNGTAENNLNLYRKGFNGKIILFEKVYSSQSKQVDKLLWYQDKIKPLLSPYINIPSIYSIQTSEIIDIVYFEYLKKESVSVEVFVQSSVEITKILYEASVSINGQRIIEIAPEGYQNFQNHFLFKRDKQARNRRFQSLGIDIVKLEKKIECSEKVITHGDIKLTNFLGKTTLIDWDDFGIYPIGFDPAFIYFKLISYDNKQSVDYEKWLSTHYENLISPSQWIEFKRNFLYFLLVFCQSIFKNNQFKNLENQLIKDLNTIYYP